MTGANTSVIIQRLHYDYVDKTNIQRLYGEHTMANFATLKKSSGDLDRLNKAVEKLNTPTTTERKEDERFWKLERDKAGNASAVIRFLPPAAVDGDDALPWVRIWDHGFKGPTGKWYIEKSLTSLGDKIKDPVGEFNSHLWNLSEDDNSWSRKQARNQKRRLSYVSNILVISDPKHPENEGKVFLFKFGKKIFDKITAAMNPQFEGDAPVNPFNFWKGANFKLRIRMFEGFPNYELSQFDNPSALSDDDSKLEAIWKKQYSLNELVSKDQFKSYEDLKARLDEVLAGDPAYEEFTGGKKKPAAQTFDRPAASKPAVNAEDDSVPFATDDEDDEDLQAFKKLAM